MRNDEELTEEEKARRGIEILGLLSLLGARKETEQVASWEPMAKVEKDMYDSYVKVGFTPEQALTLSERKTSLLIEKLMPPLDDLDPRFK